MPRTEGGEISKNFSPVENFQLYGYFVNLIIQVFDMEILYEKAELLLGEMWDIYLITAMSGLVLLIIMWRRHRR